MSTPPFGVVAVGNALVDVLAHADDKFIEEQHAAFGMEKGAMVLIDENRAEQLYDDMEAGMESSGGSAANTMAGFASFGGKGAFIGKTANDHLGKIFSHDIRAIGVSFETQPLIMGAKTGRCLILITPDADRTMNTFLGASIEITDSDIDQNVINQAQITYLEGYLFDQEKAKKAFYRAAEYAHAAGHDIALTLSDPFCVDRHREDFIDLVEHHVDILFANEDEIKSLYQVDTFEEAASLVSNHVKIAVLTCGDKGAIIRTGSKMTAIKAVPVNHIIDSTGAGDQFAAGFLFGLSQDMPIEICGKLGALAAAEVIAHIGPRPQMHYADLIKIATAD